MMRPAALALAVFLVAGTACSDATEPLTRVADGKYGGLDIGLDVSASGTTLRFDCAVGAISGPIALASDGSFDVAGTFTGGGNAFGADHTTHAIRYRGRATRDVVRLINVDSIGIGASDTLVAELGVMPN